MAALTAAAFAVSIPYRGIRRVQGKKVVYGTLTLTGGTDTYPTGGIPLPDRPFFGFTRQMDSLELQQEGGETTSYAPSYDKSAHKLMLFASHDTAGVTTLPMDEQDTAEAPGTRVWRFIATGW